MTSNRELARQLGVSETAVRRAEKAGRIGREANGAWDPARVKAAWASNTDQAQQWPARSSRPRGNRRALKPVPEAALGAVRDTLREHGEPVSAGGMTFMQARTANEVLKAQQKLSKGTLKLVSQVEPGAGQRGTSLRYRCQVACPSTGMTMISPSSRGIDPITRLPATIRPQAAIGPGLFTTARTDVATAV